MSNELIPAYQAICQQPTAIMEFVEKVGTAFHQGGLCGVSSKGQGQMLALTCLTEGMTPMQFSRTYHLMDGGKLQMRSDHMLAEFKAKPGNKWKWIATGDDGKRATAKVTTPDDEQEVSFSIEDAERAGLVRKSGTKREDGSVRKASTWEKDPGAMLRARLISKAVRMLDPEIIAGCYAEGELPEETGQAAATQTRPKGKPKQQQQPADDDAVDAEFEVKTDKPAAKPKADTPTQAEVDKAAAEAKQKVDASMAKGEELAGKTDADYDDAPATREQIDELKQLVIDLDYAEKFKAALRNLGVSAARSLNNGQARTFIESLRNIQNSGD